MLNKVVCEFFALLISFFLTSAFIRTFIMNDQTKLIQLQKKTCPDT